MKKLILLFAITFISFGTYAQVSLFDKFEDMDDVTTVIFTQDAFKLISKFNVGGEEGQEYNDMVKGLTSFRVFTTENTGIASQMATAFNKYIKSTKLTELMRIKEKGTNVKFYVRKGKDEDHVSELLMYVNGISKYMKDSDSPIKAESVILSLTGNINLNNIPKLIDAHVPNTGKYLNKKN